MREPLKSNTVGDAGVRIVELLGVGDGFVVQVGVVVPRVRCLQRAQIFQTRQLM